MLMKLTEIALNNQERLKILTLLMQSVATTLNAKATFSEKPVVLKLPLKDLKNLPELESLLEKADVRDNLASDVLNYF